MPGEQPSQKAGYRKGCLAFVLGALALGIMFALWTPKQPTELLAAAGCEPAGASIRNMGTSAWSDVEVEINRKYSRHLASVPAGADLALAYRSFTDGNAVRFDVSRSACQTLDIHATVDGDRRHWNGAAK